MLVITRKPRQSVLVGPDIRILVLETRADVVRLGIEAPSNVTVLREELTDEIRRSNQQAATVDVDALQAWSLELRERMTTTPEPDLRSVLLDLRQELLGLAEQPCARRALSQCETALSLLER